MQYEIIKSKTGIYQAKAQVENKFRKKLGIYPDQKILTTYIASDGSPVGAAIIHDWEGVAIIDKLVGLNGSGEQLLEAIIKKHKNVSLMCKINNPAQHLYLKHMEGPLYNQDRMVFYTGDVSESIIRSTMNKQTYWRN